MAIDLGYDEGGSGDDLLVSVQVGITQQARKLKRRWKARLPEGLLYFHSKDFGNFSGGVFTKAGLDEAARTVLLKDLASVIHSHMIFAATARISIKEYESLTTQDFRSRHGTAYGFAVNTCMLAAYSVVKEMGLSPEFNILIEKGHRNSEQVAQILDKLQRIPAEVQARNAKELGIIPDIQILTVGLGEKAVHPILQAADMVAYSEWQGINNRDRAIWDAINRNESGTYRFRRIVCDEQLIRGFVKAAETEIIRRQREANEKYGK